MTMAMAMAGRTNVPSRDLLGGGEPASPGNPSLLRVTLIVVGAVLLAGLTVVSAVANIARAGNPGLALKFAPYDSGANARLADRLLQIGRSPSDLAKAADHARQSLRRSPLSPVGARVIAFVDEGSGQRARARALVLQSALLSRRDTATRLWLIEDAVARNDVSRALEQFDIAMRPSSVARTILYPVLTNAIADPEFIDPVVRLFRKSPNWAGEFILGALATGKASENLSVIVARSPNIAPPDADLRQATIDQLVREQNYGAARRFFSAVRGTKSGDLVNDRRFRSEGGLTPFNWSYVSAGTFGAQPADDGLRLYADSSAGGSVAGQLLTLPPGRYRLSTIGYARSADRYGGAEWIMACASPKTGNIAVLRLPGHPQRQRASMTLAVPTQCAAQWLRLGIRASQAPDGVIGTVHEVRIERAAG